ncbi:MAG: hypothetical protein ABSA70_00785 [Terriglobia bacterium]
MNYPRLTAPVIVCLLASLTVVAGATALFQASAPAKARLQATASPEIPNQPPILFVQAPVVSAGESRFPKGSRLVRLASGAKPQTVVNLTPEFFAAADPQISFDGTKVVFAAQELPGASWQLWEMHADGSGKRQVTRLSGDCLRPAYLAREGIVFTFLSGETGRSASQVYVCKLDGSEAHPITFGPGNFQVETVLKDGRVLVSASSPLAPEAKESAELYTLRHDGTGLASFRCEHRQPAVRGQATELDDGSIVYVKSASLQHGVGGELAAIRRGELHNSSLSPLVSISWSPRPLEARKLIVARQSTVPGANPGRFDLYAFDFASGQYGELIYRDPKLSSVQAVPVAAHPVPRWYWSTLNPKADAGYFICLDSRLSADVPQGRISAPVARVRVLMLEPATNQEHALGEAPVEKDGSFYLAVPPDRPVRFELLDESGRVVRAQRSWIWARPGEERGCVGCHEDKAVAPENRWPLALKSFDTPTRLGVEPQAVASH